MLRPAMETAQCIKADEIVPRAAARLGYNTNELKEYHPPKGARHID